MNAKPQATIATITNHRKENTLQGTVPCAPSGPSTWPRQIVFGRGAVQQLGDIATAFARQESVDRHRPDPRKGRPARARSATASGGRPCRVGVHRRRAGAVDAGRPGVLRHGQDGSARRARRRRRRQQHGPRQARRHLAQARRRPARLRRRRQNPRPRLPAHLRADHRRHRLGSLGGDVSSPIPTITSRSASSRIVCGQPSPSSIRLMTVSVPPQGDRRQRHRRPDARH